MFTVRCTILVYERSWDLRLPTYLLLSTPTDLEVREQHHVNNVQVSIETQSAATRSINEAISLLISHPLF